MLFSSLIFFTHALSVIIAVSFYTLFERKLLSSAHIRQGPTMVGPMGLLQPFSDGIKLFTNQLIWLKSSNFIVYLLAPLFSLGWSISLVSVVSSEQSSYIWVFLPLSLLLIITLGLIPLMVSGWSSNSPWALLGSIRGVAQSVSYEVSLAFLVSLWLASSLSLDPCHSRDLSSHPGLLLLPLSLCWLLSILAEVNRTPFDFSEAESELVSGFNVEYSSGWFAVIFISEYSAMIIFSLVSVLLLSSSTMTLSVWMLVSTGLYFLVWVRCTLPRTRYDKLMSLNWFTILPVTLSGLFLYLLL